MWQFCIAYEIFWNHKLVLHSSSGVWDFWVKSWHRKAVYSNLLSLIVEICDVQTIRNVFHYEHFLALFNHSQVESVLSKMQQCQSFRGAICIMLIHKFKEFILYDKKSVAHKYWHVLSATINIYNYDRKTIFG